MSEPNLSLDPKLLGFWVKCIREASNWSQEALAAAAGLDVRTIQRAEAGSPISLASRRSLARGLGFDDYDVFQNSTFIDGVKEILGSIKKIKEDEFHKQFPDCLRLKASLVSSADDLKAIIQANAYSFTADSNLSPEAKEVAAYFFDYLRDLGDGFNDLSYGDKLKCINELRPILVELETLDAVVFSAKRLTSITSTNWIDRTPMPVDIGYVAVTPRAAEVREMIVAKHLKFEF